MKTYEKKTFDIIVKHSLAFEDYKKFTKELLEEAVAKSDKWKADALKNEVNTQLQTYKEQFEAKETTFNNELQLVVEEVKSEMDLNGIENRPSDYAARITNANEYLKMEGSDITDDEAYLILKDFIGDMNQMLLFKRYMEKNGVEFLNSNGQTRFPKTFGKVHEHLALLNAINEFEGIAENTFLNSTTQSGETYRFNKVAYHVPTESYHSKVHPNILLNLAKEIDHYLEIA